MAQPVVKTVTELKASAKVIPGTATVESEPELISEPMEDDDIILVIHDEPAVEEPVAQPVVKTVTELKASAKVIPGVTTVESKPELASESVVDDVTLVVHEEPIVEKPVAQPVAKTVAELKASAKVIPGITTVESKPELVSESVADDVVLVANKEIVVDEQLTHTVAKSAERYIITENAKSAKVITAKSEAPVEAETIVSEPEVDSTEDQVDRVLTVDYTATKKILGKEIPTVEVENNTLENAEESDNVETVAMSNAFSGYSIIEKHDEARVINKATETEAEGAYEPVITETYAEGIYIPRGTKILNSSKSKERYVLAETHVASKNNRIEPIALIGSHGEEQSDKYFINEKPGTEHTVLRSVKDNDTYNKPVVCEDIGSEHKVAPASQYKPYAGLVVYEDVGSERKIAAMEQPKYSTDPVVYEEIGSERIISTDSYKAPERPLVYEEIGTERIIQVLPDYDEEIDDSIIEYKDITNVVHSKIPVVDVYVNPYADKDIEVISSDGLKRFIAKTNKEIAKLKSELKQAQKRKEACEKVSDKVVPHIDIINTQCLICEKYVVRVVAAVKMANETLAKRNAQVLSDEIKVYNKLITEYNDMTEFTKVPLADKTIVKRVLAGQPYEHFKRIAYNPINEKEGLKTNKKIKAKIIQEDRYIADIKLLERRDEETRKDLTMIENRYDFESSLLQGERDLIAIKFAKNSIDNEKRKAYINRKLKSLKKDKEKALKFEAMDNARYYKVFTTDTNFTSYSENTAKKKRVNSIIAEVGELLKKRDEINAKLTAVYSGDLGDIEGVGNGDKWRDIKLAAAKRHSRRLKGKADMLKRTVSGFGEDKARKIFIFNSLLDAKVESLATIDLCKYRLRKENPALAEAGQIKKDIRDAKLRVKLIDKEIRERRKLVLDEHYGTTDISTTLTALVAIGVVAIGVAIGVAYYFNYDILGLLETVKTTLMTWFEQAKIMAGDMPGKVMPVLTDLYNRVMDFFNNLK